MAGFIRGAKIRNGIEKKFILKSDGTESDAGLRGAFRSDETVKFSVDKNISANSIRLLIFCDGNGETIEYSMLRDENGVFCTTVSMAELFVRRGLFFYEYIIENEHGTFFIAVNSDDFSETVKDSPPNDTELFQLLVYEKRERYPNFFEGGIVYQIFPDRFFRGGDEPLTNGARMNLDWYGGNVEYCEPGDKNFKNNMFFGGDIPGIEKKLPYISSLGVTAIYLNPIFVSASNHKYDTGDYMHIDPMFGGDGAFRSLLKSAKSYGISIILDGVFNHTGDDSIYFNKYGNYNSLGAYNSKESPYADWYNFYSFPDKYESWWGFSNLPRVMSDTPSYKEFLFGENGVIRKYIREGIAGWRLDVADELSDSFLSELSAAARKEKDDVIIIGEVWEDASNKISYSKRRTYFNGKELDSVMNYPMRNAVISYVRDGDYKSFLLTANTLYRNYPREVTNVLLNILGTHDTVRAITALAGKSSDGLSKKALSEKKMTDEEYALGIKRLEIAYFMLSLIPGVPCIYYGDEIGMEGENDPFNRRPYPWGRENEQLLDFYRKVGKMRRNIPELADAEFEIPFADSEILVFERTKGKKTFVTTINRSDEKYIFTCSYGAEDMLSGESGEKFCIDPLSARCFGIGKDDIYGVTPDYEK